MTRASAHEIEARNLTKKYGKNTAVDAIDFTVKAGSITAFLGPNGAGKTTTIKMMTGLTEPNSGEIFFRGTPFYPGSTEPKRLIGVVPQHNNVDRDLTVTQNLMVHAMLYGMNRERTKRRIAEMLEFAGLTAHADKKADELSGGMKRRLVIARALLHEPSILFLDEPTVGLDPATRRHMWDFIRKINRQAGATVFLTTHYIEEADLLAETVMFIDRGKITAAGKPDAMKAKLGGFAVEVFRDDSIAEEFFPDRDAAVSRLKTLDAPAKVREVNLEDVYLSITGRRIDT